MLSEANISGWLAWSGLQKEMTETLRFAQNDYLAKTPNDKSTVRELTSEGANQLDETSVPDF